MKQLLDSARHPDQMVEIVKRLDKEGIDINQSRLFGFLTVWRLIGPFDNVGSKNFDKEFPIEADFVQGKLKDSYEGKTGNAEWKSEETDNPEGNVDIAKAYNNEKGCIVYAHTVYVSDRDQPAELRLGTSNANKAWVNGKLVISNEVYHTGQQIDQYTGTIQLKKGKNQILLKICQNEQTEQWAQLFAFQVRVCDASGKAILSTDANQKSKKPEPKQSSSGS